MIKMKATLSIFLAALLVVISSGPADAKRNRDRAARDFRHADEDGNGNLSRVEWKRRGNFMRLDANADGNLSLDEVRAIVSVRSGRGISAGVSIRPGRF